MAKLIFDILTIVGVALGSTALYVAIRLIPGFVMGILTYWLFLS